MNSSIDEEVVLCGLRFLVQEHEGAIVFSMMDNIWSTGERFAFARHCECWHVEVATTSGEVMMSHLVSAYDLVCNRYGANHECPRGQHVP